MIFDINILDDDNCIIFSCDGIDRDNFNKYFIESCQIQSTGEYYMKLNDYRHAINRIYEAAV